MTRQWVVKLADGTQDVQSASWAWEDDGVLIFAAESHDDEDEHWVLLCAYAPDTWTRVDVVVPHG